MTFNVNLRNQRTIEGLLAFVKFVLPILSIHLATLKQRSQLFLCILYEFLELGSNSGQLIYHEEHEDA